MKGACIKMMISGVNDMNTKLSVNGAGVDTQDISPARLKAMKRSGQVECETCANREYKDGSDEANVSFRSAEGRMCQAVSPILQLNILQHHTDRTRNQQIILNLPVKMWIMQDN